VSSEQIQKLIDGLKAVEALIDESRGVAGLHLNGDLAPWKDLRTGGRLEDWLVAFDDALDVIWRREQENAR
jgi:hypothetical protein